MRPAVCLLTLFWIILAATSAEACTCLSVERDGGPLVGRNYDWDFSDGLVMVNKRGFEKPIRLDPSEPGSSWFAKYGSVTFNQYGRDFPTGGVNETGLVVEVLWLRGTVFPPDDERTALNSLQWIQYELDTASSVDEVIASLEKVRVTGTVQIHFYIADRTGAAAAIEYLEGEGVVHRTGESMPVAVLTNHTYQDSEVFLRSCEGWGGKEPLPEGDRSLPRFVRAATAARELREEGGAPTVADLFRILEDVASPDRTQWSIVYDLARMEIHLRTRKREKVRSISLADLDFACATPVKMIDIDLDASGDLRERWIDYTRAANRDLIGRSYEKTDFLRGTPATTLDLLAGHPERARCGR